MSITWSEAYIKGDPPCPRSGHTITVVGQKAVVFGGVGRKDNKPQSFNDIYFAEVNQEEHEVKFTAGKPVDGGPAPRSKHTAIALDGKRMLVFGGIDHKTRFNDIWVYNVPSQKWEHPKTEGTLPPPRAHHAACKVDNRIFIFGGYGGAAKVYGDMWVLEMPTEDDQPYKWSEVTPRGKGPSPRFDHAMTFFPDHVAIFGGRDTNGMFSDTFFLDAREMAWKEMPQPPMFKSDVSNHLFAGIESVPQWKIFTFGGKQGTMQYLNGVELMDCGSLVWTTPTILDEPPVPREDTAWFYDNKSCHLVVFGGWANRWLGDAYLLNVSPIIGPPYACMAVGPHVGPVFGDTEVTISGLNFKDGKIEVKFGGGKTESIAVGKFVDERTITCRTPNFEAFGALPVDLRVNINNEGWTVNKVTFTYFANPSAKFSMAYGPGLLPQGIAGVEMPFIIQSKDTCNNKRTTGGDTFAVEVVSEDGKQKGLVRIVDTDTGTYDVFYMVPAPGKYLVHCNFDELGDSPQLLPIRGSPFKIECLDPWTYTKISGAQPNRPKEGRLVSLAGHEVALYNPLDCSVVIGKHDNNTTWAFTNIAFPEGSDKITPRKQPCVIPLSKDELVVHSGLGNDGREVDDLWMLTKEGETWSWSMAKNLTHLPAKRAPAKESSHAAPAGEGAEGAAAEGEEGAAPHPEPAPAEDDGPTTFGLAGHVGVPVSGFAQGQVVDRKIMVFGGVRELTIQGGMEFFDLAADGKAIEFAVKGEMPSARRAAAVCAESKSVAYMYGGVGLDVMEEEVVLGDLLRLTTTGKTITIEKLECTGPAPGPRYDASIYFYDKGKVLLCGGTIRDEAGKETKLSDMFLLDTEHKVWQQIYMGGPDLGPQGPVTMFKTMLCGLGGPSSNPQFTTVGTLDLLAKHDSFQFIKRMKTEGISQLERVAGWIERQATGLDMAFNMESLQEDFTRLVKVLEALFNVRAKANEIDLEIDQVKEIMIHLKKSKMPNLAKHEKELDETELRWSEIKKEGPNVRKMVEELQKQEGERIKREIFQLEQECKDFRKAFNAKAFLLYDTGYKAAILQLDKEVAPELKALKDKVHEFSNYANIFEFPDLVKVSLDLLNECAEDAQAARETWESVYSVLQQNDAWCATMWSKVNTDELDAGVRQFVKDKRNLPKRSVDMNMYKGFDAFLKNLMTTIPMVADLRSPAMRPRHWQLLMKATNKTFVMDDNFKLGDLLALELHKFEEEVSEIVDRAQKEDKLDLGLQKLRDIWGKVDFEFHPHKGSSVQTVKMKDEDFEVLEDNQVLVQGMMANRYMDTFRDDILGWNKKLSDVYDVVSIMSEIQRTWAYLESLFLYSDEVKKELPEASTKFVKIDQDIKVVLADFLQVKNVVNCCAKDGLMKRLEFLQSELEICEKALADFMESKRRSFPRFYFVSTADLLDILSNGNDPTKVMKHMSKVFQAIEKLKLDNEAPAAGTRPKGLGIESCVGVEYIPFKTPLPLEGKVEMYMNATIQKMREELRLLLADSVVDYPKKPRHQWLFDWSSQMILVANQIFWCQEVEEAYAALAKNPKAMDEYNQKQIAQITKLVEVTRTDLKKPDRQKVMNMITIDAHSRDIVARMVETGETDVRCFAWVSQLRSYWESDIQDCRTRICDASFPYGYEYLGNGPRLVITPLTDRIYITATQACWLCLGTAPAGPAGTGKTETTKDLASQLGKAVYVFNCAPEMDYRTMGDIFKGLAASGSWGCFDEFNRLVPEVLSVCSVQYKCVTDSQRRKSALPGRGLEYIDAQGVKHPAIDKWTFIAADGIEMPLEEGTSCFITMNPGYIGRAELPESLKILFRPITVVVPDRQLIMENMLIAEGFVEAKMLAKKFASLYYLLEDLLSPQKHYDWGLRAIKSVLVVAGSLLRSEEGQEEADVLYRALRDFNVPKILSMDMDVFMGLLQDLFPGVDPPRKRDMEFEDVIRHTAVEMGLTAEDDFVLRVVQLSELLAIRHCVFLMGPTGTGRTEAYRVLAASLQKGTSAPFDTYLQANNKKKVTIRDIDPKAITTQELYGYVNMATREWKDGLLSYHMRDLANLPDDNPKWILLDGDLDANWIESMNSVMDDNRLLTLPSNERIRLLPHMKLMFEIRDLKFATPATATRAGILYISEGEQWFNMVKSWLQRVARPYCDKAKFKDVDAQVDAFEQLFMRYVPETVFEMKKSYSHITPLNTMNWVTTMVNILEGLLKPEIVNIKSDPAVFEMLFAFATVWAFGGALCSKDGIDYRKNFHRWFSNKFTSVKLGAGKGEIYDFYVDAKRGKFSPWSDLVQPVTFDSMRSTLSSVFVPTAQTAALAYFLDMMIALKKPIMLVGGAGVGKTQLVKGKLGALDESQASLTINFNYFTDVIAFQKLMESKLEKKAGINYGPPGNKTLIYFVDDLNMPQLDKYETAMPISLVRQHLGWGHWYDRQKLTVKNIKSTQYVACMNPTAGSFVVNPRLQRLFMTLAVDFPSQDSLVEIYGTFIRGHLQHFPEPIKQLEIKIVGAALALHDKVQQTFRKTAVNFHYEFTVRHLSNVFQGLLMSKPPQFDAHPKFLALWLHESERVYADRLVSAEDFATYKKKAEEVCRKFFEGEGLEDYLKGKYPLLFNHFVGGANSDRNYDQADSFDQVQTVLMAALEEYNETHPVMDLVLFEDAIGHVCRVSRVILNPGGHALLVGVGGSGKQSLARLACHLCGYETVTLVMSGNYSMNNFAEDLLKMYKRAGIREEGLGFLFTDSQIVDERMMVYINDLLASGDIPDIMAQEDRDEIAGAMRAACKAAGVPDSWENCYSLFLERVRSNLHMCFTVNPVGDEFRIRAQRFPAMVNSTVIDWFHPWPEKSLQSVAQKFLGDLEVESEEVRQTVVAFMPFSFQSVNDMSKKYLDLERRYCYTTPKSFLELIKLYRNILASKRLALNENLERLTVGLNKLNKTKGEVDVLMAEAEIKSKEVEQKVREANEFAEKVGQEKEKVNLENEAALIEAEKCGEIAREVAEKQTSCEADLAQAEPLVQQAEAALDTLNKKDLGEAKSLKKPPAGVDDITAVVLILLEGNPKDKSWQAACKLMNNVDKFLERLKGFKGLLDSGQVAKKNVDACRSYLELPHFDKEVIRNKSAAAAGLCDWAINIVKYYDVVSMVEPKRQELAEANRKLEEANTTLRQVQEKVAELNRQVQELERAFNEAVAEKEAAIQESERCQRKLGLANRLIRALASEGERWAASLTTMRRDYSALTGDMLLAAAFVSYAGPFTNKYRQKLIQNWVAWLLEKKAPMTEGLTDPLKALVNDAIVAQWLAEGLPADPTSVQNGTILTNSERWPLMIDPQLQGIVWIKERESKNGLQVVRLGFPKLLSTIERALEAGTSVLIENIGEQIDAVLTPVITRSTYKKGGRFYVKIGDKDVEYNKNFRLFLHTKLSNPHYPPGIQAECTLINMTVTEKGLEDQLLALVVNKERPELEKKKTSLIVEITQYTIKLKELEEDLLFKLSTAEGDLTENVPLIESLEESKRVSDEVSVKVADARRTEITINEARERYRPVAARGSMLFFLLNSLNKIHAFYQFSLNAFVVVFLRGIDLAPYGKKQEIKLDLAAVANLKGAVRRMKRSSNWNESALAAETPSLKDAFRKSSFRASSTSERISEAHGHEHHHDGPPPVAIEGGHQVETITEEGGAAAAAPPPEVVPEAQAVPELPEPNLDEPVNLEELAKRLESLIDTITFTVFNFTRRGLFDRDKLIVSSMLAFSVLLRASEMEADIFDALCMGGRTAKPPNITDELSRWMTDSQWAALDALTKLGQFANLAKEMEKNSDPWQKWVQGEQVERMVMPGEYGKLPLYKQLLVIRALRPDRLTAALTLFVTQVLGDRYINQDPFNARAVYEESSNLTPIFFILFPGYSPSKEIEALGLRYDMTLANGKLTILSMGQGQEAPAEAILDKYTKEGGWVFLDNVHLMQGWLGKLERKLELAAESGHSDFRCFFSAEPINGAPQAKIIPESILQGCLKVSNEPPSDLKSNMRRAFAAFSEDDFERITTDQKRLDYKCLLFGLCFYHSLLLGRRKFGTGIGMGSGSGMGFCQRYSFNMGDLTTCADVLRNYLEGNDTVPWDDLRYMFGEVFYGGHITDNMDRRCCNTYLEVLMKVEMLPGEGGAAPLLDLGPGFKAPPPQSYEEFRQYIEKAMPAESPAMYGLHPNAELSLLTSEGENLFRTVIEVNGGGSGGASGGGSGTDAIKQKLSRFQENLPEPLNLIDIESRVKTKTPYVVIALQETARINVLLEEMKRSMEELQLGLDGALNMTEQMEALAKAMATNGVPMRWMAQMSTRIQEVLSLSAWYADVQKRHEQLRHWTAGQVVMPKSVWMPGLFNPKAFLTAVMQTYARAQKLPLDVMKYMTDVTTKTPEQIDSVAPEGVYVHGFVIEGARWDKQAGSLKESMPKELHPAMPVIQIRPVTQDKYTTQGYYQCPVYVNMQRANVYCPIQAVFTLKSKDPSSKWVLSSVALLLQDELA